jgi:hypothetical protein
LVDDDIFLAVWKAGDRELNADTELSSREDASTFMVHGRRIGPEAISPHGEAMDGSTTVTRSPLDEDSQTGRANAHVRDDHDERRMRTFS